MSVISSFYLCIARRYEDIAMDGLRTGNLSGLKARVLREIVEDSAGSVGRCPCPEPGRSVRVYYEPLTEALRALGYCVVSVDAGVEHRALVGASGGLFGMVFEVGLSWDPILDLPVVPGSAVKGALRAFLTHLAAEKSGESRRGYLGAIAELFGAGPRLFAPDEGGWAERVFGDVVVELASAGRLLVFDAYPVGSGGGSVCGLLEPDVLTPHYYRGGEVVVDELAAEPVPVPHLSIASGTVFRFVAAVDLLPGNTVAVLAELLGLNTSDTCTVVEEALRRVLEEGGIGARTGKGYGFFTRVRAVKISYPKRQRRRGPRLSFGRRTPPPTP